MNPKKLYRHLYRVRKRDKPPVVIRTNETFTDEQKAEFDRLEDELKRMEMIIK